MFVEYVIGGGSQSSGSDVSELDQSLSPLNNSMENLLDGSIPGADGTVAEQTHYPRNLDWMSKLPARLHSMPLSRLCIPGTVTVDYISSVDGPSHSMNRDVTAQPMG